MARILPIEFEHKNLKGHYCLSPFNTLHIGTGGEVHICLCPGWLPTSIGNILTSSLTEMLSSPIAQAIRQSVINGDYRYCNHNYCALMINNQLNTYDTLPKNIVSLIDDSTKFVMPYEIIFHGDLTCNLSCPSCRTQVIKLTDSEHVKQQTISEVVYDNIFCSPTDQPIHFITSGSGEVFASKLILGVLKKIKLEEFPNLKLNLHTNGLLAPTAWHHLDNIEQAITQVTVSIDASTKDTYEKIRRGGKWEQLLSAMNFLKTKKQALGFTLHTRLIVQEGNWREIEDFYHLSKTFLADRVEYSRLTNQNTWSLTEFVEHDVLDYGHVNRVYANNLLKRISTHTDVWFEGIVLS